MGFLSCLIQKRFHLCQHTLILHTLEKGVIFVLRRKKIRCRRKRHRLKLLVPVFLLIGLFFVIECQLSPLVEKAAASQAKQMFNQSVNDAVTSQLNNKGITYTDLIHIEKATDGSVLAVTTDSLKINQLKADISLAVQAALSQEKHREFSVPLGTLTGSNLLRDKGPGIPIDISFSGSVVTDLKSEFTSAGINQTKHQILMTVKGYQVLMAPGINTTVEVETTVAVAETVIVGQVPEFMADLSALKQ